MGSLFSQIYGYFNRTMIRLPTGGVLLGNLRRRIFPKRSSLNQTVASGRMSMRRIWAATPNSEPSSSTRTMVAWQHTQHFSPEVSSGGCAGCAGSPDSRLGLAGGPLGAGCGDDHGLLHGRHVGAAKLYFHLVHLVGLVGLVVGLHQQFHGERIVLILFQVRDGVFVFLLFHEQSPRCAVVRTLDHAVAAAVG